MSVPIADAISLNRDSKAHLPEFRLAMIPTVDEQHCSAWSRQLGKLATTWEHRKATPDLWRQIPASSGIYMFVWRIPIEFSVGGKDSHFFRFLVYCGQAGAGQSRSTLRDRYKNEYSKYLKGDPAKLFDESPINGRAELLSRWLLVHPLEYWWAEVGDTTNIAALEKELIRIMSPPLNTQHKLLRASTRKPAF